MPPARTKTDPELLLRNAISAVAVPAYSRAINLTVHVDSRLPDRIAPRLEDLPDFLRRGLLRTIKTASGGKVALALWLEELAADGSVRVLLEVCRSKAAAGPPTVARLVDVWTLPLGDGTVRPREHRRDAAAETVLIPLSFLSDPGAPLVGSHWGRAFQGRRLLHARDVLFDKPRLRQSMAQIGAELGFAETPDAALAALGAAAAAGRPFDVVVVDANAGEAAAVDLARRIRADSALASTRIVLASALRGEALAEEDALLFDVLPWAAAPWRRLLEVLRDLLRDDAREPAEPARGRAAAHGGAAVPMLAGRRILVAEDVETNRVMLQAVLAHTGAAIEVVADGADVVARHGAEPADLIVMDLQMPGMGGIAALRAIRAMEGPASAVPVIALTAHARSSDRQIALAAGMDAYLAKPIIVEEFYELLRRLLPIRAG